MPSTAANIIPTNRKIRSVMPALYMGMEKDEIAVTATTMTRNGLTIPAFTAASPIIRPPTMPIAGPIGFGSRIPASRRISMDTSKIRTSMIEGNGTPWRVSMMLITSSVGINPG
ncbi:hypothetical protein D3C75_868420 [compost metagenome]